MPAEAMSITGLPILQVQAPSSSPVREVPLPQAAAWLSPNSAARELGSLEEQMDDGSDLNEEAAMGRLSSMSLMAAVTASGKCGYFLLRWCTAF